MTGPVYVAAVGAVGLALVTLAYRINVRVTGRDVAVLTLMTAAMVGAGFRVAPASGWLAAAFWVMAVWSAALTLTGFRRRGRP